MKKLLGLIGFVALSTFANADSISTNTWVGGAIGAGVGAVVGHEVGDRDGAILGAAIGGAAGAAIGSDTQRRHRPAPVVREVRYVEPHYYWEDDHDHGKRRWKRFHHDNGLHLGQYRHDDDRHRYYYRRFD